MQIHGLRIRRAFTLR